MEKENKENRAEEKQDPVAKYLVSSLKEFLFDELAPSFWEKNGLGDTMKGVQIPIKIRQLKDGLSNIKIAQNMAYLMGADYTFIYNEKYKEYIISLFTKDFVKVLIGEGAKFAEKGEFIDAIILFRASLYIDKDNVDALYCYARALKDAYEEESLKEDDKDVNLIRDFKRLSLETFERLTIIKPEFDMGYYFLGYGYLNLGLYTKTSLTWETFVELTKDGELKAEIKDWLVKLEEPVVIEDGYNKVISGKIYEGLKILEKYKDDERYNKWWPLWYYLGIAYEDIGDMEEAVNSYLEVLKLSPSNDEVMDRLSILYYSLGDEVKAEKYKKKSDIVKNNPYEE